MMVVNSNYIDGSKMVETDALLREVALLYTQAQRTTAACCDIKSQTQCLVITELGRHQPLTPLELADRLGYEKSWMSRVVGQLFNENLIAKQSNPDDGRSYFLTLTPGGEARFNQLNLVLNTHAERIMAAVPPEQQESVTNALILIRDALLREADSLEEVAMACVTN